MNPRRPNLAAAAADFAFAALAFASGWICAPIGYAAFVFLGAVAAWAWTRREALRAMARARLLTNTALALAMMAVVLGGVYWLGLLLRGQA
ncbi:MAG: hypothetical protein ABL883_10390 [Terricaulis sp.]